MPQASVYGYLAVALVLATPFFLVFGWLSDKVGRKWIMLTGCVLSAALFIPHFQALAKTGNPGLMEFRERTQVIIQGDDCREDQSFIGQLLNPRATKPCTRAKSFLTAQGVTYKVEDTTGEMRILIGEKSHQGFDEKTIRQALLESGMPAAAPTANRRPSRCLDALSAHLSGDCRIRADGRVPRRAVSNEDSLQRRVGGVAVWKRMDWRVRSIHCHGNGGEHGRHVQGFALHHYRLTGHGRHRRALYSRPHRHRHA